MAAKDELGRQGEQLAAGHLTSLGMTVIERNWRCPQGEIDLVMLDDGETVFVEVKTRSSVRYGHPFEAINAVKLARLRRLVAAWCDAHAGNHDRVRIDAIAIVVPAIGEPTIDHIERVF